VGALQSALGVGWCGRVFFVLATCSLQSGKAGCASALSQQEKSNSADVQRGGFIPHGDTSSASSCRWPIASRRARHRRRLFGPQLRRLRLRHKTSVWASGGPAEANRAIIWLELNHFACGTKSRRRHPAALPGEDMWRYASCDGAQRPCSANNTFERPTTKK
jgi:hypothetical protein